MTHSTAFPSFQLANSSDQYHHGTKSVLIDKHRTTRKRLSAVGIPKSAKAELGRSFYNNDSES